MFIDTHCHIEDPKLVDKEQIIKNAEESGVGIMFNMGCDVETSIMGARLSDKFSSVYFGSGIHPQDVEKCDESSFDKIKELSSHPKCVVIGEIGLDYYWKPYDKNKQIFCFERQISLANEVCLPINVHCRDATEDMVNILKANKNLLANGGVMHCYSGSLEIAKILLNLGMHISFSGSVTFKNSNKIKEVAKYVPLDRILTETDSPYITPEPLRGTINQPANVKYVAEYIASLKDMSVNDFTTNVYNNVKSLFKKLQ